MVDAGIYSGLVSNSGRARFMSLGADVFGLPRSIFSPIFQVQQSGCDLQFTCYDDKMVDRREQLKSICFFAR